VYTWHEDLLLCQSRRNGRQGCRLRRLAAQRVVQPLSAKLFDRRTLRRARITTLEATRGDSS